MLHEENKEKVSFYLPDITVHHINWKVLTSCYARVRALWLKNKLSEAQKDVLKSQLDINNAEVIHKLSLANDDKVVTLSGDLLFHQNVLGSIDGTYMVPMN